MTARAALPDLADRRAAVSDFEHNLVVLAGAGTGKTSLLVERVLNAVGSGRVAIDRLAAITFTEKAAAEMRQRVAEGLEALRAAARGEREPGKESAARRSHAWLRDEAEVGSDEVALRALEALEKLDRAKILTIHGLCSEILRAYPLESGVDPGFEVDTGERGRVLSQELWEEFLARELGGPGAERAALWENVLSRATLADVAAVGRALGELGVPERALRLPVPTPDVRELFAEEATRLAGSVDGLLRRASGMNDRFETLLRTAAAALRTLVAEGVEAFKDRVDAGGLDARRLLEKDKGLPSPGARLAGASADEVHALGKRVTALSSILLQADDALGRSVVEAVAPFARRMREELLRRGWVGFDGLLALARDLLRDHPEVRRELKRRYGMLLVDEFQDTDPMQYEIVLLLAEREEGSGDDAWRSSLEPGRLFVVGDPKQSIYRFRGADFSAFHRTVERIVEQGGRRLELVANFRSVEPLVGPVNALFGTERSTCWAPGECQPEYEPIRAVRPAEGDGPGVELWTVQMPQGSLAERRRRYEGNVIAEAIDRLVRREKRTELRRVAILFRTFASIPYYLRPLREREIPFVVDGGKDFIKRPEIAQSLAVLRTLAQPADPIALLAFLRSPAGGVRDAELAAFAETGRSWDWRVALERTDGLERIAECFGLLKRLRDATRNLPADTVVRRVVEETRLLPLAAAAFEGAQRVANLEKLAAAAGRLARDGKLSLEDVVEQLREGGLAELEADSPLSDDAADAVRITSIHKMKGLESDWVFLPDLGRWDRGPSPEANACRVTWPGALGPTLALRVAGIPNSAWALSQVEDERHEEAEETRVLYVALTRARDKLVLVASPPGSRRSPTRWFRALEAWGYDAGHPPLDGATLLEGRVLHRVVESPAPRRLKAVKEAVRPRQALERYREAVARLREQAVPAFGSPSATEEERESAMQADDAERAPIRVRRSRDLGMAAGRVVHRALESWDGKEAERLRRAASRSCEDEAEESEVDRVRLEREVAEILDAFLGSDLARRFGEVERVGAEIPPLLRDASGRSWRGSIDLLYRDGDGGLFVADYKTEDEEDERALVERYAPQLAIYREAVAGALGLATPPGAELWLLRSGRRVPLPEGGGDEPRVTGGEGGQLSLW